MLKQTITRLNSYGNIKLEAYRSLYRSPGYHFHDMFKTRPVVVAILNFESLLKI